MASYNRFPKDGDIEPIQSKKRERKHDEVFETLKEQVNWQKIEGEQRYKDKKKRKKGSKWEDNWNDEDWD